MRNKLLFPVLTLLIAAPSPAAMIHFAPPLSTVRITSGYGERINPVTGKPDFHAGVDIAAQLNQPVMSISNGTVLKAGPRGLLGNAVEISSNGTSAIYGHLNKVLVNPGESVKQGQVIGLAGSTGRSTGPHVHLAIKRDGQLLSPVAYMDGAIPAESQSTRLIASLPHGMSYTRHTNRNTVSVGKQMNVPAAPHMVAVKFEAPKPPKPSASQIQAAQLAFKQAEEASKTYSDLYNQGAVSRNDAQQKEQLEEAAKAHLIALSKASANS